MTLGLNEICVVLVADRAYLKTCDPKHYNGVSVKEKKIEKKKDRFPSLVPPCSVFNLYASRAHIIYIRVHSEKEGALI